MLTAVTIFALLLLALALCATLAIAFLALTWGIPAAAAFVVLVYADRLDLDLQLAMCGALLAFVLARMTIVWTIRLLLALWYTATESWPQHATAR